MHFSPAHVNPFLLYEAGSGCVYTSLKCVAGREQPTSPAEHRERAVSCYTLGISACGPADHHITGSLTLPDRVKSSRQLGEYVLPASDSHAAAAADPFFCNFYESPGTFQLTTEYLTSFLQKPFLSPEMSSTFLLPKTYLYVCSLPIAFCANLHLSASYLDWFRGWALMLNLSAAFSCVCVCLCVNVYGACR